MTEQHDYRLVLLSAMICAATSFTSFSIYSRVVQGHGLSRLGWLFLTGMSTGSGIWATHFVAMLSYNAGLPTAYDPLVVAISLLVAVASTTFGYFVCSQGAQLHASVGGAVIGLGIGLMHFTAMRALVVPGTLAWDISLVAAALSVGVVFGSASMLAFQRDQNLRGIVMAAGLFTIAICGLHFTAMGAAVVEPDPTIAVEDFAADAPMMALAIAVITVLVLLTGLAAAVIDRQRSQDSVNSIRELVDAASEGIVIAEDGVIVNVNRRVSELSGRPAETLIGLRIAGDLLDGHAARPPRDGLITAETALNAIGGRQIPVEIVCQPFRAKVRGNEVYAIRDLTERHHNERQIAHMARHDALTDLPNRSLLWERLEQSIEHVAHGEVVAVICLDLDRFKEVNDTLGHPIGDAVLRIVAERLRVCVRSTDTIARLGGDEFAILQRGASQPVGAASLARRIVDRLGEPYLIDGHQILIGASVGVALSPNDSLGAGQLLQSADLALYCAKREGRSTYRFFEQGMDTRMRQRRALETDLRNALPNGEFELYYQPIINVERNRVSGFEALLRWNHPERGLVSPGEFMPLAEETGLIDAIGEWVLRKACAEAATWAGGLRIAVNVSPCQFKSKSLVDAVFNAIARSGLAAHRLELEITESVLLKNTEATISMLRQLQAVGVRIVLDDFGTGYSSLSHLQSFRFDKIKIDRCFVEGLDRDSRESRTIVRAASQIGASLGMCTTAEGVETERQFDAIRAEGCTEVQGFFFSPAKPAREIGKLLSDQPVAA